ncbi:hypothetical protein [Ammoniphilus sp. CFH 90114]|uniref:hypothetical protein n=1 Tax=Ammoniphilus sp. CFH 90114 TaxID=2493665 RepID=UPI00100F5A33|nr:hypothetical protein [Ammoniphilus sp. CFH 90114]RXT07780.1 hypothetical protein EIZ39_10125 [Ammoniphilus sp. CFH 90114]
MNSAKAYGSFTRLGSYVFRTKAHLQYGSSVEPIGMLYMLNPGESRLEDETPLGSADGVS